MSQSVVICLTVIKTVLIELLYTRAEIKHMQWQCLYPYNFLWLLFIIESLTEWRKKVFE